MVQTWVGLAMLAAAWWVHRRQQQPRGADNGHASRRDRGNADRDSKDPVPPQPDRSAPVGARGEHHDSLEDEHAAGGDDGDFRGGGAANADRAGHQERNLNGGAPAEESEAAVEKAARGAEEIRGTGEERQDPEGVEAPLSEDGDPPEGDPPEGETA